MPTHESWLNQTIIQTVWKKRLTSRELFECFNTLATRIETADTPVHILFDIQNSGTIPADAPVLAIRSGFLNKSQTGKIAVVGMHIVPQVLAKVAVTVTRKDITFFPTRKSALIYLMKEDAQISVE